MPTWSERINEKVVHRVPELGETDKVSLRQQLIDDAFVQIMDYSNANVYNPKWDNLLVNCVVTLYNYLGTEGSDVRVVDGIRDEYNSANILSPLLSRNLTQIIRPIGYIYSSNRFNMPD